MMSKSQFVMVFFFCLLTGIPSGCGQGSGASGSGDKSAQTHEETPKAVAISPAEAEEQLRQSSLDGDLKKVKESLEAGAGVNAVDMDGRTALMFAAFNGHSEVVLELLGREASVDRRDVFGRTALLYAATGPFTETVKILLDKGAEPNVVDSEEHFSPLMHAAAEGNLDVVKILFEAGADAALTDVDGDNAASFARQAGHQAVADYLESAR
jgi:ankyrin repeat protein